MLRKKRQDNQHYLIVGHTGTLGDQITLLQKQVLLLFQKLGN